MASRKWLVIDADVARAAGGEDAVHHTSKSCRDFLKAVLDICHHVVMTREISDEWNTHQSRFTAAWRSSMVARRKLHPLNINADKLLREKIEITADDEKSRRAMLKDVQLVEAALEADKIVISLDETVHELFVYASKSVIEMKTIVWVNPCRVDEKPIEWLEKGARAEKDRQLGHLRIVKGKS